MVSGFKATAIKPIKTVGQRLKEARKRKELTLEMAENLTKVKLKYLKALEQDRHDLLPTEVYSLGFLRCYAEILGINPKKIMQQYQTESRAFQSAKAPMAQELAPARRLSTSRFLLTPKTLVLTGSLLLVIGLVAYIGSGIRSFLAPPVLAIDQPKPDIRISTNSLTVTGKTDPAASLTINGELVTIKPDGQFKQDIGIVPGLNILEFIAVNRVGKETRTSRKVLSDYKVAAADVVPSPVPSPAASSAVESPSPNPTQ